MGGAVGDWAEAYSDRFVLYEAAAELAKGSILDSLRGYVHGVQEVQARAKKPDSVSEKITRRHYVDPANDFDDLVGVRVLVLYESSIPRIVERLKATFAVDESRSSDKTANLGPRQVGYRSRHLVLRISAPDASDAAKLLGETHVEVQVRSVVSHAWAEIEHSLRYKAGEGIPEEISRRFDALAGTLELVDLEFSRIEGDLAAYVARLASYYKDGIKTDDPLSSIQLLAGLRVAKPHMRSLGPHDFALEIEDAFRLAKELVEVGVTTVAELLGAIQHEQTHADVRTYVDLGAVDFAAEEASALVVLGSVIGRRDVDHLRRLRLFSSDLALMSVFETP